jgi:hypothetical protein
MFEALLDDIPLLRTPTGQRRRRPEKVHADKAYDHRRCRRYLSGRRIKVRIARCGIDSSQRLGRHRWKAERSIAWLAGCRRLWVRYDRDSERFFAFAMLACDRLCYNRLPCVVDAHERSPWRPGPMSWRSLGFSSPQPVAVPCKSRCGASNPTSTAATALRRAGMSSSHNLAAGDRFWVGGRAPGLATTPMAGPAPEANPRKRRRRFSDVAPRRQGECLACATSG